MKHILPSEIASPVASRARFELFIALFVRQEGTTHRRRAGRQVAV